jgi:cell division septation protein DedD
MNDHNLDDLIIGDPEPGGGKSKSLLSLVALVLIILIVGVLLAKLIFSGPEELDEAAPTELTGLVKPDAKAKPSAKAKPVEKIPDELKPITRESLPESDDLKPIAPRAATPKPAPKPAEKKTEERPAPAAKPVAEQPKAKPKPKPKAKPAELFEKKPAAKPAATGRTYYIQLGSFKRMPDQKFLDKIKAAGYEPLIIKTGTMIKVRIGTYGSYGEAKAKLPEIKQKLGIDGFVVRKK